MATPTLDPSLPADNAPIVSGELRGQFQAIQDALTDLNNRLSAVESKLGGLSNFSISVSDPPVQAEVQAIGDALTTVITELQS